MGQTQKGSASGNGGPGGTSTGGTGCWPRTPRGFATRVLGETEQTCPVTGAAVGPIYAASTFVFDNLEEAAGRFAGEREGFVYSRLGNPTVAQFERALAVAEEGEEAVGFASGMAAIAAALMTVVSAGDHIVAPRSIYGSTFGLMHDFLKRFGIEVSTAANEDIESWRRALRPNTKLLYTETPANPTLVPTDLAAWAALGKEVGAVTVVDNTFATPYLQRPITLGVDVVVHSATKYISGHGDVIAGALVSSAEFCGAVRGGVLKDLGGTLSPFDAWLLTRGLKTLPVRMEQQQRSAQAVAEYLSRHPKVRAVFYPGLDGVDGDAGKPEAGIGAAESGAVGEPETTAVRNVESGAGADAAESGAAVDAVESGAGADAAESGAGADAVGSGAGADADLGAGGGTAAESGSGSAINNSVHRKQMDGPGAMLSFEVVGGLAGAEAVLNRVRLARLAVSLGEAGTLIQHPWSMTHSFVPENERRAMGVTEGLIRLSVGLEDAEDIIADLESALG